MSLCNKRIYSILSSLLYAGAVGFCGAALAQGNMQDHAGMKQAGDSSSETQQLSNDIQNYNQTGGSTNNPPPKPHVQSGKPSPQAQNLGNDIQNYNQTGGSTNNPPPKPHVQSGKPSPQAQQLGNDVQNYNQSGGSTNKPQTEPSIDENPDAK